MAEAAKPIPAIKKPRAFVAEPDLFEKCVYQLRYLFEEESNLKPSSHINEDIYQIYSMHLPNRTGAG